jgi:hypothetical protein
MLAGLIGMVVLLCLLVFREGPQKTQADAFTSLSPTTSVSSPKPPSNVLPPPGSSESAHKSSLLDRDRVAVADLGASGTDGGTVGASQPPDTQAIFVGNFGSAAFAVVDLQHVLTTHQLESGSSDARSNFLRSVKHIIALRSASHNLGCVFDVSAERSAHTPLILFTNGVLDITDEVLQEISK